MAKTESHIVPVLPEKIRLSDYAGGIFRTIPSRKGMKKAIDKGWVHINGKLASTSDYLRGGETIEFAFEETVERPTIELKIEVLFQDEFLAVVNKPAGIEVSGNRKWTLENALSINLKPSSESDALKYPEPIHRLDYPTSGALLIGKTNAAVSELNRMFAGREIAKTYLAITIGKMPDSGIVDSEIDGKSSLSEFKLLQSVKSERFGHLNLVELNPKTGRRHQLRKHMAETGNPILGDREYGSEGLILSGKGLYLHSVSLSFVHPFTKEKLTVEAPLPKKFLKIFP
ncbi:MAG: RluA family pseudouridine synthase [Flavobacteriales bacterium]|nr:RluA family pseudouridine synthase [Flavobacteriales bacterium]